MSPPPSARKRARCHLPIASRRGGDGSSNASNLRTSRLQSLALQRIAGFSTPRTRPPIHHPYPAGCPVAGKGARPCDLVAAGVCGAGSDRGMPAASKDEVAPDRQRVWRRESDRSGDGHARHPPSRRGRGSGKGLTPPLVREIEPYSSRITMHAERLSFAETVFSILLRVRARTLRRPFPSLQREIA